MKLLIDADACPRGVKKICEEYSLKYNFKLLMIIDDAHELSGNFEVIKVGKGNDAVDHEIVRQCEKGDILVSQDYGLASILLDKASLIIHPNGFKYTKYNIDSLMYQRFVGQKIRNSGGRTKNIKKRKEENNMKFEEILKEELKKLRII